MGKVTFTSWSGKIVDNRKAKTPKPSKPADITFPKPPEEEKVSALIGWNGLVVMNPEADIVSLTLQYLKQIRKLSCGECSICMIGIDKLLHIMRQMDEGKGSKADIAEMKAIIKQVSVNSKCGFGQSALFPVLDSIRYYRSDFLALIKGERELEDKDYSYAVTAPCMDACPAGLDVPGYIELVRNDKFEESLDLIRENCILPGVVGRVCTHPCEDACVRKDIDEPVSIRLLKRAAADYNLQHGGSPLNGLQKEREEKIAIIGAGPAGLAAAYNLRLMGYGVTIFESLPHAGGMAAVGIPEYRLPRDILNHEVDLIKRIGVEIKVNAKVEKLSLKDLKKRGYAAVFVAVGAHRGTKIGAEGEDKGYEGFVDGVEFLRDLNLGKKVQPRKKVIVIGGGNTALDCARSCARIGFDDVEIIYRRSRVEMPASDEEIEEAEREGVKFNYLMTPVKILAKDGKATGVVCIKMKLGEPDETGRRRPVPIKGSELTMDTDMIIPAIGQRPELPVIPGTEKIEITKWGTIKVHPLTYMTDVEGVFAGGDCVTGPAILIDALNTGNQVAKSIDCYLQGNSLAGRISFEGVDLKKQRGHGFIINRAAEKVDFLDVKKRARSFEEVESGFAAMEAISEAQRCLRCYRVVVYEKAP
ncbi:MAG: FAD-dependent oxidoreductase [Deltaproteobacteria bacterium]|nr:MAG: FAD-dependent oxidoreductase [Deltaproteobacteria bacterium]